MYDPLVGRLVWWSGGLLLGCCGPVCRSVSLVVCGSVGLVVCWSVGLWLGCCGPVGQFVWCSVGLFVCLVDLLVVWWRSGGVVVCSWSGVCWLLCGVVLAALLPCCNVVGRWGCWLTCCVVGLCLLVCWSVGQLIAVVLVSWCHG